MKVTSSALQWQVQHSATRLQAQSTRLEAWVGPRPARAAAATGQPSARALAAASTAAVARNAPAPQAASSTKARDADPAKALTPHLAMVRDLIERMTGIRAQELRLADAPAADPVVLQDPRAAAVASPRPEFGLEFEQHTVLEETEQTQWAAQGVVHTADGQEIRFSLQLQMQRSYREETHLLVRLGNAVQPVDPLVINFDGTAAQLQDLRFAFDLDGDGHTEQVPLLAGQRAYLALDGNRNQRIDDGRELFGPATGNGYSELAEHDEDGNGWIDANDTVYGELRLWTPEAEGPGHLRTLQEAGVGALALAAADTPFSLRTADNRTLGAVRATSVYLREDGGVGSTQQIDLVA